MKPLHQDEQWKLRCLAITDHLKRMCLSDAYIDICLHLDKCTASLMKPDLALSIPKRLVTLVADLQMAELIQYT